MRRKIIRQGKVSLTMSLPKEWIRRNRVDAKDELEVTEQGNRLILTTIKESAEERKSALNIDKMNESLIRRYMNAFYINGITEVTLTYTKNTSYNRKTGKNEPILPFLQDLVDQNIGVSITQQSKAETVFKMVTMAKPEEFESSLNRALSILIQTPQDIIESIQEDNKETLEFNINFSDKNLNRTIFYAHSILNSYGKETNSKSNNYFLLLNQLEELGDLHLKIIKIIKKDPKKHKDIIPLYKTIKHLIEEFKKLHNNYTIEKTISLYDELEDFIKKVDTIKDVEKSGTLRLVREQMVELIQSLIALKSE